MIKRTKVCVKDEENIATGCIVSSDFIRNYQPLHASEYFQNDYTKLVVKWCLEHYSQYNEAPIDQIETIHRSRAHKLDESVSNCVKRLLDKLSDDYDESFNSDFMLDQCRKYFKRRSLELLKDKLDLHLTSGDLSAAEQATIGFNKVIGESDESVEPMTDTEFIDEVFSAERNIPLIRFPGALGDLINDSLCREDFVCFLAPQKRGKSYMLMDFAKRGLMAGHNVALFLAGDMNKHELGTRLYINIAGKHKREKYCGNQVESCLDCQHNQNNTCTNENRTSDHGVGGYSFEEFHEVKNYQVCTYCRRRDPAEYIPALWWKIVDLGTPLDADSCKEQLERFNTRYKGKLKLRGYANKTATIGDMESQLRVWEAQDQFVPDIIVLDYLDVVAPSIKGEFRQQDNDNYSRFRSLLQTWKCLGVSAMQANAAAMDAESLTLSNFSENVRRFDHVTSLLTLNQTRDEKRQKVLRIDQLLVREEEESPGEVTVLQSLHRGRPITDSFINTIEEDF